MTLALQLSIRLIVATFIGAVIGYERQLRSKDAGIRTHVLVAVGAALFMIISQYGFYEALKFDAARIAAGVVSGISFIGGGIIIKQQSKVSGLTTAAGLWVTGAIGLSVGCGMYELAVLASIIVLVCMEVVNAYTFKYGDREVHAVLSSHDEKKLQEAMVMLKKQIKDYGISKKDGVFRISVLLSVPKRENAIDLITRLENIPGVELESLE